METTKYDALKFYEIANYIDPFQSCYMDKKEEIESIMSQSFEDNLKYLQEYICEGYDDVKDLLDNEILLNMYLNLVKRGKRKNER